MTLKYITKRIEKTIEDFLSAWNIQMNQKLEKKTNSCFRADPFNLEAFTLFMTTENRKHPALYSQVQSELNAIIK